MAHLLHITELESARLQCSAHDNKSSAVSVQMSSSGAVAGSGASPAYILETSDERHAWHYAMPKDAPEGCSVSGCGLGEYVPMKNASAVVGVVGSAHVGGIVREWQDAADQEKLSRLLKAAAVHTDVSAD